MDEITGLQGVVREISAEVIEQARDRAVVLTEVSRPDENHYFIAHPNTIVIEPVDLQWLTDKPRSKTGTAKLVTEQSFIDYVNRHREPGTIVLAEENRLTAYIDHHQPGLAGDPGWCRHQAFLTLVYTAGWASWQEFIADWRDQEEFAYFLEDRIGDIAEPDGAELLELARDLKVSLDATYDRAVITRDGTMQFTYREDLQVTGATTGGQIAVPERLTLGLKPFEGIDDPYRIPARLRYRLRNGHIQFRILLGDEALQVFEDAYNAMLDQIAAALDGVPVLRGKWSATS